jgi:hypothetical protein
VRGLKRKKVLNPEAFRYGVNLQIWRKGSRDLKKGFEGPSLPVGRQGFKDLRLNIQNSKIKLCQERGEMRTLKFILFDKLEFKEFFCKLINIFFMTFLSNAGGNNYYHDLFPYDFIDDSVSLSCGSYTSES